MKQPRDYSTDKGASQRKRLTRSRYPANWKDLRAAILARAESCCEGLPGAPPCGAPHGGAHPVTGGRVTLQIAHLDHNIRNNTPENLRALCSSCHGRLDAKERKYSKAWRALVEEIKARRKKLRLPYWEA